MEESLMFIFVHMEKVQLQLCLPSPKCYIFHPCDKLLLGEEVNIHVYDPTALSKTLGHF